MAVSSTLVQDGSSDFYIRNIGLLAYPVGSFFFNINPTSPADLFGGDWELLSQGTFLMSQGSSYKAGSTGGEASHTLTINEIPSHAHNPATYKAISGWSKTSPGTYLCNDKMGGYEQTNTTLSSYVGGSQGHNNLPPYLAVYIWKRIA